jgi:short-subunit dehydrogenase
MKQKVIVITGGTSGIGKQLALDYLKAGHIVHVTGRDLDKVVDLKTKFPETCHPSRVDVQVREQVLQFFHQIEAPIDLVIANAGRSVGKKSSRPDFNASFDVIQTNLLGVLATFEGAFENMEKNGGGHLVAVSSVAGFIGLPGAASYSSSKAGVYKLCESLSLDLGPYGIDVTCICPGFIDTPLTQKNNHPMPFLMTAERASRLIRSAIETKKALYLFPWQMKLIVTILDKMPRALYRFLMKNAGLDYRKNKETL